MKEKEDRLEAGVFFRSGHFHPSLRKELIKAIEAGTPRSVIAYQYGVSRAAISKWMRRHGSPAYRSKQQGTDLTVAEKRLLKKNAELVVYDPLEMKDKPEDQPGWIKHTKKTPFGQFKKAPSATLK